MKEAEFLVDSLIQDRDVLEKAYEIIRSRLSKLTEYPSALCHYEIGTRGEWGYCLLHMINHKRMGKT